MAKVRSRDRSELDELGEELALAASCATPTHLRSVRLVQFLFSLIGVEHEQPGCKLSLRARLISKLLIVWIHYGFLKTLLMGSMQFSHDALLKQWQPRLRPGARHWAGQLHNRCALSEDVVADEASWRRLALIETLRGWLAHCGHNNTSITGTVVMLFNYLAAFTLVFPLASYYCLPLRPSQLSFLSFLLDPVAERQRLQKKLERFVGALARQSLPAVKLSFAGLDMKQLSKEQLLEKTARLREEYRLTSLIWAACRRGAVLPSNRGARWHQQLLHSYYKSGATIVWSAAAATCLMMCALLVAESALRAEHRLNLFRCQLRHPNATLLRLQAVRLNPLERHQDVELYRRLASELAEPSVLQLVKLGVRLELLGNVSLLSLLTVFEFGFLGILLQVIVSFYLTFFIYSLNDTLAWLLQLHRQLDQTLELLELSRGARDRGRQPSSRNQLAVSALINLLNFSLFKDRFKPFQRTTNLLIGQMSLCTALTMIGCYVVSVKTESRVVQIVSMSLSFLMSVINLYLGTGSYLFGRVSNLMRKMMRLVALLKAERDHNLDFVAELWRRQLLDRAEMNDSFSLHSFGARISYDKLILFNAYSLGLFMILFRIES